jgi:hypothetical protein
MKGKWKSHQIYQHFTQGLKPNWPMIVITHNLGTISQFSTSQLMANNSFTLVLVHSSSEQTGLPSLWWERSPTMSFHYHPQKTSFVALNSFKFLWVSELIKKSPFPKYHLKYQCEETPRKVCNWILDSGPSKPTLYLKMICKKSGVQIPGHGRYRSSQPGLHNKYWESPTKKKYGMVAHNWNPETASPWEAEVGRLRAKACPEKSKAYLKIN